MKYTINEFAEMANVNPETVRGWVKNGKVKSETLFYVDGRRPKHYVICESLDDEHIHASVRKHFNISNNYSKVIEDIINIETAKLSKAELVSILNIIGIIGISIANKVGELD